MSGTENFNDYPKHPGQTTPRPYYVEIPLETFETMSEELAELRKHELAWDLDKARIKELEAENESLKYSVATLDTDLAMMKRWRKFPDEKPNEEMEGEDFLVSNGYYSVVCEWRGYWNNEPFCGDRHCDEVKYWMPKPKDPEVR